MTALIASRRPARWIPRAWRYLLSLDAVARIAIGVFTFLILVAVLGRIFLLGGSSTASVGQRLAAPSAAFPLGTDSLGRSLLPRLIEGMGTTLVLSATAVVVTATLGTIAGIVAGYRGGRLGGTIMRLIDVLYAFPAIVLAILVATVVGPGTIATVASIVLVTVPLMTRMVGVAARSASGRDYVAIARLSGVSHARIMARHVFPNVAGTVVVQATYAMSVAMLVEGGLSYLGYGVQLPTSSLGLLIQEGAVYMLVAPWMIFAPGLVLVLAILSINLIGDSLRDRFEPREVRTLE